MTGFAASELAVGAHRLIWEIRSVNHRFLDLGFRLPEDFRALESELRKRIGSELSRGKVDCTLKLVAGGGGASGRLNRAASVELAPDEDEKRDAQQQTAGVEYKAIDHPQGIIRI